MQAPSSIRGARCAQLRPSSALMIAGRPSRVSSRVVRCQAAPATEVATAAPTAAAAKSGVASVDASTYHAFLADNAHRLVVVDVYTDWCGPCKMIAPEVEKMAAEFPDVAFAKLNAGANDESKRLAMALGVKALPTFHLYRNSKKTDEMTGAKAANLRAMVSKHM